MRARTRRWTPSGTVGAVGMVAAGSMVANVCMYLVHLLAGGRFLRPDEYGEFAVLLSAMLVLGVPALAVQVVVAREVVRGVGPRRLYPLIARTVVGVVVLTLLALAPVVWLARSDLATTAAALAAAPLITAICAGQGILQGRGEFRALALTLGAVGVARSVPVIVAFALGAGPAGGLLAGTVGAGVSVVAVWGLLGWSVLREPEGGRYRSSDLAVPEARDGRGRSLLGVARASQVQLVLIVATSVDLLLARTALSAEDAGVYALGAIATKVAFWLPQAIGVVFYPRLADPAQAGASLRQAIGVVAAIGAVLTVGAGAAGPLVPLVMGDDYRPLVGVLGLFAFTGAALSVLQVALLSAIARDHTRVALLTWAVLVAEIVTIVVAVTTVTQLVVVAACAATLSAAVTVVYSLRSR